MGVDLNFTVTPPSCIRRSYYEVRTRKRIHQASRRAAAGRHATPRVDDVDSTPYN